MWLPRCCMIYLILHSLILRYTAHSLLFWHTLYLLFLFVRTRSLKLPKYKELLKAITSKKQSQVEQTCSICIMPKPPRFYHCRTCNHCVFMMDHHCFWLGVCIGQYNAKLYIHLLFNVFINFVGVIIVGVLSLCLGGENDGWLILLIIPVGYGIFESGRLIHDWIHSVKLNQTLIQSYKRVKGHKISFQKSAQIYFGILNWKWLLPIQADDSHVNLLDKTYPQKGQIIKQNTYADEYLYGTDSDDEEDSKLINEDEEQPEQEKVVFAFGVTQMDKRD